MKILYIDPESFDAHINYNKLQIQALRNIASEIELVLKKGYDKHLRTTENVICIPKYLYLKTSNGIINRLLMLCRYWYILLKLNFKLLAYDAIIISYFDEIVLFFSQLFPKKTYLINHVNISGIFRNKTKRFFYKKISQKYNQIVLDNMSEQYLRSLKIKNVNIVRHGIVNPYQTDPSIHEENLIFCPSSNSVDKQLIESILSDPEIIGFLKSTNYKLILKGNYNVSTSESIIILNRYIEDNEYKSLILRSRILFLPYSTNFIYRASGVLFEGIANNKIIISRSLPSLMQYKSQYKNLYGFINKNDFKKILKQVISLHDINNEKQIKNLMPDYSFLKNTNKND